MTLWPTQTYGDLSLPACVFLHGWLGSGNDWQTVVEALQASFCCITVDLPGHGAHTLENDSESLDFSKLAPALHDTIQSVLGERTLVLLGYSMGGRIALRYALQYPDTLVGLVLESSQPGLTSPHERRQRANLDEKGAQTLVEKGLPQFLERWYSAPLFRSLHQHPERLQEMIKERATNRPDDVARVLRELSPGRQQPVWDQLPQIALPTLLLTGQLDPKYPRILQQMQPQLPDSQITIVENAGHNVHWESPQAWLQHVTPFLHQCSNKNSRSWTL